MTRILQDRVMPEAILRKIGIAMEQNTPASDYLAPNIAELSMHRVNTVMDPLNMSKRPQSQMTRAIARRLLPACLVAPAVLWWVLFFGVHRGWYELETCFVLFVYSVTVAFGLDRLF